MKFRNGFVSNSSSSSFIIGYKNSFTEDFDKEIYIPPSCFSNIIKNIKDCFKRNTKETYETLSEYFHSDYYPYNKIEDLLNKGYKVSIGSISDECDYDMIDNYLCHQKIVYNSENLVIEKEGSY